MGAANDKASASGELASQYPFLCCTECTVCSASSETETTKAGSSEQPHTLNNNSKIPPKPPNFRPPLSFSGKLPEDWSPAQQQWLQWAVEEIAKSSNIRPPGYRAMQEIQTARRDKRELTGHYNLRFHSLSCNIF